MNVELGNALAPTAIPGVSRDSLERLDEDVARAHERIERGIEKGTFGYKALALGETIDPDQIVDTVEDLPTGNTVLVIGMGGSALGARALAGALAPEREWHVLDTVDPTLLERRLSQVNLADAVCHVVSHSGSTVETRVTFELVRDAMEDAGIDWDERTVATTPEDGHLGKVMERAGVSRFDPPAGVPGRYSILSTMALPSAAMLDIDIESLLRGGRSAREGLAPSLFESPAYAYGATMMALSARGVSQNAFIPYAEDLDGVAHWFGQLWAESLGKDGLGQTPIAGRGIADHHAHLQRWRSGPRDIVVTTLSVAHGTSVSLTPDDDLGEIDLAELHDLERRAAEASLVIDGRPTVRLELDAIEPGDLGELFVNLEAACILYGELRSINPFDQPAVEWAKQAVRDELKGYDTHRTRKLEDEPILHVP